MGRPRHRRSGKHRQGFSGPGQRPAWDLITRGADIKGRKKRLFFNQLSGIMVLSAGVGGAFFGYSVLGWLGTIIGFVVAAGLMGKFMVRRRYYR